MKNRCRTVSNSSFSRCNPRIYAFAMRCTVSEGLLNNFIRSESRGIGHSVAHTLRSYTPLRDTRSLHPAIAPMCANLLIATPSSIATTPLRRRVCPESKIGSTRMRLIWRQILGGCGSHMCFVPCRIAVRSCRSGSSGHGKCALTSARLSTTAHHREKLDVSILN